jgi:hypothetical protein
MSKLNCPQPYSSGVYNDPGHTASYRSTHLHICIILLSVVEYPIHMVLLYRNPKPTHIPMYEGNYCCLQVR